MHFHFDFSASQILWTLTFAGELVLLVVLLGRDRARRFPMFTSSIVIGALLLLVSRLLFGRMSQMTTSEIFLAISDVAAAVGLLVLAEVARRAFEGVSRKAWRIGAVSVLVVGVGILIWWGPWPPRSAFQGGSLVTTLRTMQLIADKGAILGSLFAIELGILTLLFGRRYKAGWRTHPHQIVLGLSTAAISQLGVSILWQQIATRVTIHTQAEYEHALNLRDRIYNGNNVVYFLVLVWWIAWLWLDEPGAVAMADVSAPSSSEDIVESQSS